MNYAQEHQKKGENNYTNLVYTKLENNSDLYKPGEQLYSKEKKWAKIIL